MGLESNVQFWYIKDPHFSSRFLKIAFTIMNNLKLSIGPDFCFIGTNIIENVYYYQTTFFSIKPKGLIIESKNKLLKNGLIELSKLRNLDELRLLESLLP